MTKQTQTAFTVLKAGIDKGIKSGIFESMEEVLNLVEAYNHLIEVNRVLESELGKEKEKCKILEQQSQNGHVKGEVVEELENS